MLQLILKYIQIRVVLPAIIDNFGCYYVFKKLYNPKMSLEMSLENTMQVSVNIVYTLERTLKKSVAMNLVVPISRNCLNNFYFSFL